MAQSIQEWLKEQEKKRNPGAGLDEDEEPWPISRVAPISDRCREAFRNLGILDE
jgi:hypothetical protein